MEGLASYFVQLNSKNMKNLGRPITSHEIEWEKFPTKEKPTADSITNRIVAYLKRIITSLKYSANLKARESFWTKSMCLVLPCYKNQTKKNLQTNIPLMKMTWWIFYCCECIRAHLSACNLIDILLYIIMCSGMR